MACVGGYTLVADARRVYKKIQQLLGTNMPAEFKFVRRAHTQDSHTPIQHLSVGNSKVSVEYEKVPSCIHATTVNPVVDLIPFCTVCCTNQVIARKSLAADIPKKDTGMSFDAN